MTKEVFVRGSGSYIFTSSGRKLLDLTSGIGVTNTGHCHAKIVAAAKAQCDNLIHGQVNLGYHTPMLELTETLVPLMPSSNLDRIFYSTTGAEAVENAIKLARYTTQRNSIIVFQGGYHGRTHLTMGMTTSSTIYKQHMMATNQGIFVAPFPYELHGDSTEKCLQDLNILLKQQVVPTDVAAMIIEPVLGEGGYVPVPKAFVKGLREICNQHGILLIMDEVQTGFGRTGKLFSSEYFGQQDTNVHCDILVMAKGLASGFPISAVAANHSLTEQQEPGTMGGTYAGNAVACAAAVATQQVIQEEALVANAQVMGERLWKGLDEIKSRYTDIIRDVRGPGCMIGLELHQDAPITNKELSLACLDQNMLLLTASIFPSVRFIPPLTISKEEVDEGLDLFEKALKQCVGKQ